MGGKLDATNILNNQAISVISKIARDHQGFLGNTLEEIASHKAGILKPHVPFIVNPTNEWNVHNVIDRHARKIGAGPRLTIDTYELHEQLFASLEWRYFTHSLRPFQRDNAVLAFVAVQKALQIVGQPTDIAVLRRLLAALQPNPGRLHKVKVPPVFGVPNKPEDARRSVIVDGAHNPDAAIALDDYITQVERTKPIDGELPPEGGWPVTWVLAMTDGKDALRYLQTILRPGDNVITTTFGPVDGMPWVKPMDPKQLLDIAFYVQPGITGVHMPLSGPLRALITAKYLTQDKHPIVLTGSLYLVGDFYRELRSRKSEGWWTDKSKESDRALFREMHDEERLRAHQALGGNTNTYDSDSSAPKDVKAERRQELQEEIERLDREIERLETEEAHISQPQSFEHDALDDALSVFHTRKKGDESTLNSHIFDDADTAQKKTTNNSSTFDTASGVKKFRPRIIKHFTKIGTSEQGEASRNTWNASIPIDSNSAESQNGVKIHKHYAQLGEGDRADGHPRRQRLKKSLKESSPKSRVRRLDTGHEHMGTST